MAGSSSNTPVDETAVGKATALFAEHDSFIRAVIRFQARNEFLEDDLYQEFFLTLVASPVPANVYNIKSYLYRAIVNDVIDSARRQGRRQKYLKKFAEQSRISVHNRATRDAILEMAERDSALAYWTRQLQGREAEAVTLKYRDNRSMVDIAREMGIDCDTVSHYLSKGLRRLRRNCALE